MYDIKFYRKENGQAPALKYIESLSPKLRAKTQRSVMLLEEYGPVLGEPDSKKLDDQIFELRTSFGSDTGRVLYFFVTGKTIVLTNGFLKKTNKTPRGEIKRAHQYRADYLERESADE